uniref:Carboxylic ester hydrolase n=1 Tax=Arion vulgaris TaxID=1028688 RepID=A0A0B7B3D6_9EUPU
MLHLWYFLLPVGFVVCLNDVSDLITESQAGTFRGKIISAFNGAEFVSYRGIPFALPPTGEKRFALPEPFPKIENVVFDALDFGPICVQHMNGRAFGQEDCLYLNVFTPLKAKDSTNVPLKKVLVFIYGGGFVVGSSNNYTPGDFVTKNNLIVVTFNYRVGWMGFLRGNSDSLPGNQAFYDQVLALKWIKNNIQAFGGDPEDITISGESAGSLSVSVLAISPLTTNLFSKAILMSGTAFTFPSPPQTTTDLLDTLSTTLGCENDTDVVSCLKQQPAEKFVMKFSSALLVSLVSSGDSLLPFPIPELIQDVEYLNEVGFFNRDYIVSITKEDGYIRVNSAFGKIDTSSLESSIVDLSKLFQFPEYVAESLLLEYLKTYEEVERAVIAISTDYFYLQRSNHFLETYGRLSLQGENQPKKNAYFMSFDHAPHYFPHQYAPHALDLLYLFDFNIQTFLTGFFFIESTGEFNDDDLKLKEEYSHLIAAFVKTGNPNEFLTKEKSIVWSPHDNDYKHYLSFSLQPSVHQDVYGDRRIIWEELIPQWKKEYEILQTKQEL